MEKRSEPCNEFPYNSRNTSYSCESSADTCNPFAVTLHRYKQPVQEASSAQVQKLCHNKAPDSRTDPPGPPVTRARRRAAGVQGQHSDLARLEDPGEQGVFQSTQQREAEGGKANHELR